MKDQSETEQNHVLTIDVVTNGDDIEIQINVDPSITIEQAHRLFSALI